MTLIITTLSVIELIVTFSIKAFSNLTLSISIKRCYAECHGNVVMLSAVMLSFIILNDVMLSVMAPSQHIIIKER
jgi:hypothetical protein